MKFVLISGEQKEKCLYFECTKLAVYCSGKKVLQYITEIVILLISTNFQYKPQVNRSKFISETVDE